MMDTDDESYLYFDDDVYITSDDNEWYDDYDDYDDYGMCSIDSDHMEYVRCPVSFDEQSMRVLREELGISGSGDETRNPLSLLDICAGKIALNFPFAYIEDHMPPVPEDVQLKIIAYSFPPNIEKIKQYCTLNNGSSTEFEKGIGIIKSVQDLTQIGFHLSANVECRTYRQVWYGAPPGKKPPTLYVSVKFDRGKITETSCPCESTNSWCSHVIAMCIARIHMSEKCVMKPPLSDSLNNLTSFAQLRTFTQYLIAEFKDRSILESAQSVLDRMLKPEVAKADAIKETWGAPDPTAGPGLDELPQWLICEEGLKARCTSLIGSAAIAGRGYWDANFDDSANISSVFERWGLAQLGEPIVRDYFAEIGIGISYSYNQRRGPSHSSGDREKEILKFLVTCEDLLKDDFRFSLKAVQTFTGQLVDVIEKENKRIDSSRMRGRGVGSVRESNLHLACIPICKPRACWLYYDQLARLWRLLMLNPSVSATARDEIFATLEVLQAKLAQRSEPVTPDKDRSIRWESPEHLEYLRNFSWESLRLTEDPFKNESEITTSATLFIESSKPNTSDPTTGRFPYPIELTCGDFSSSVTVFCYLVEALSVYGKREQAIHLAMNIALAVVRYYSSWLDDELNLDVRNTLSVHVEERDESGKKGKSSNKKGQGKRKNRKRGRAGSKEADDVKMQKCETGSNELLFDQVNGIIPVTCIAYLVQMLDQSQVLLAEMLKLVKIRGLALNEEEIMESDDVTDDAKSLIFKLGVIGLAMPQIQAPSIQLQAEWFDWEVYVSSIIQKSSPSTADICFLRTLTARMISLAEFNFHPPYALVMNLFHHSVKPGSLEQKSDDCICVALGTIVTSPWKQEDVSIHRRTLFECSRRHWAKLCETVLCRVSESPSHLVRALGHVFTATPMIGSTSKEKSVKVAKNATNTTRFNKLTQSMFIEKIVANLYLARGLYDYANSLNTPVGVKEFVEHSRWPERPVNDQQQLLYETAIAMVSRAFSVKNVAFDQLQLVRCNFHFKGLDALSFGLSWMCGIHYVIGFKAFEVILDRQRLQSGPVKCFNSEEVIKICTAMLESDLKCDDRVWISARDALLALVCPESEDKIPDIIKLCRNTEKQAPSKRVLLVPAICKKLLMYIPGSEALEIFRKAEYLSLAMTAMYTLFKKLEENEDERDNLDGVKELFSENSTSSADKPSTSHGSCSDEKLDPNLQLCFDLAIETMKHFYDNNPKPDYETRRRYENICEIIDLAAKKAVCDGVIKAVDNGKKGHKMFSESCVTRFIEVLCNKVQDYLLLTDFFFELSSRLANLPQRGSFGRNRVMRSEDCVLGTLCQRSSSLSVLLRRCIVELVATTRGKHLETYLKQSLETKPHNLKSHVKSMTFYGRTSLVEVLRLIKRVMTIAQDYDFESFTCRLSAQSFVTKAAVEELSDTSTTSGSSPDRFLGDELISSLLLQQMLRPTFGNLYDDYDIGW